MKLKLPASIFGSHFGRWLSLFTGIMKILLAFFVSSSIASQSANHCLSVCSETSILSPGHDYSFSWFTDFFGTDPSINVNVDILPGNSTNTCPPTPSTDLILIRAVSENVGNVSVSIPSDFAATGIWYDYYQVRISTRAGDSCLFGPIGFIRIEKGVKSQPTTAAVSPLPSLPANNSGLILSDRDILIISIVVPIAVILLIIFLVLLFLRKRRTTAGQTNKNMFEIEEVDVKKGDDELGNESVEALSRKAYQGDIVAQQEIAKRFSSSSSQLSASGPILAALASVGTDDQQHHDNMLRSIASTGKRTPGEEIERRSASTRPISVPTGVVKARVVAEAFLAELSEPHAKSPIKEEEV